MLFSLLGCHCSLKQTLSYWGQLVLPWECQHTKVMLWLEFGILVKFSKVITQQVLILSCRWGPMLSWEEQIHFLSNQHNRQASFFHSSVCTSYWFPLYSESNLQFNTERWRNNHKQSVSATSSETQGQLVRVGKSLNGREKIWAKKSQGEEEPLGTRF